MSKFEHLGHNIFVGIKTKNNGTVCSNKAKSYLANKITMRKVAIKLFCLLALTLLSFTPTVSFAADTIEFNPLIPINDQLRQKRQECRISEEPEECKKLENRLKAKVRKLRKVCKFEPDNHRCGPFQKSKKKKKIRNDKCFINPHSRECIIKLRRKAASFKRKQALCKRKPNSRLCKVRMTPKKKRQKTLREQCEKTPKHMKCKEFQRYFDIKAKALKPRKHSF